MSDNKKYYYMKLKDNFFDTDEMIMLQSMPDGYLYSDILLKLYLRSLKSEGKLMFNDMIPYNAQMIATITRHQVGTVEKALSIFSQLGLIEVLDSGAIYMMNIQNFIGTSSTEADRIRAYRSKIKEDEKALSVTNVQHLNDKCTPEIEIELDIDKEIKKDKEISTNVDTKKEKRFKKPTVEEVAEYCIQRDNGINAYQFWNHYEANGWMRGKNHIKDWKACVRTWENNRKNKPSYNTKPVEQKQDNGYYTDEFGILRDSNGNPADWNF